jgi:L-lactate dehydrogenase complex protein LldG
MTARDFGGAPARDAVLARIRTALADVPADEPPAAPAPHVHPAPGDVDRFAERAADYRATVVRVDAGEVAAAMAAACERHDARRLLVPEGVPSTYTPEDLELLADTTAAPLDRDTLAGADGVLTTCALAIAETGTIILDAGPGQGRRALTLLPDLHICVVPTDRIVANVPDAIAQLNGASAPVTFISGPSATSDIELKRVEGVHGPRRLEIIIAG